MDERVMNDILNRLGRLERETVRLRQGTMSGANAVKLGGSSTAFSDVGVLGTATNGDRVNVLTAGNDLLVLAEPDTLDAGAWASASLVNSWVTFGSPYHDPGYRKDPFGRVHLRGLAKNGSSTSATIFTLPSGYRPSNQVRFVVNSNSTAAFLQITTAGVVNMYSGGNTAFVSLNNVSFDTT